VTESRKTVTIVFTDVTGSTALGEQMDPEAMRRIMGRYFEEMRSVLEKHGGTVEKFIGDAVMAVFGIPAVHEDDALRAVRAASEMRETLAAAGEKGVLSTIAANLACALYERGEYEEAARFSLISEQSGSADDLVTQVGWRVARAMVLARRGEIDEGEALARDALARAAASEYAESNAEAYLSLGEVLRLAGRPEEAREAFESAQAVLERKGWQLSADAARAKLAELQSSGSSSQ
jgi:tetratricopeptide (TPR) repeat protein